MAVVYLMTVFCWKVARHPPAWTHFTGSWNNKSVHGKHTNTADKRHAW